MGGGRLRVSGGFLLVLAVLFYLDEGDGLLFSGLLACAFHELGHILVIRLLGGRIERLELTAAGAVLVLDPYAPLSYGKEVAAALAGPLSNLLCGGVAAALGCFLSAGLNFAAALFNLLPICPMDGGRVLCALLSGRLDAETVERVSAVLSGTLLGALLGAGLMLAKQLGNPTLAVSAGILLACTLKGRAIPFFAPNVKKVLANRGKLW